MTDTPKPIKIEETDLQETEKKVNALITRMNGYETKITELQKQIKELNKLYKEDEEELKKIKGEDKKKKEKLDNIDSLLAQLETKMGTFDASLDETINLIELPPKDSSSS